MCPDHLVEAGDAIDAEFRRSSATIKLKCRGVEPAGLPAARALASTTLTSAFKADALHDALVKDDTP